MKNQIEENFSIANQDTKIIDEKEFYENASIQFISSGIACHALCLLDYIGILKILLNDKKINKKQIKNFKNPALVQAALITLNGAKILELKNNQYFLTKLGQYVIKKISFITMPLIGYKRLFFNQFSLYDNPNSFNIKDIDFAKVALASIDFGKYDLDPLLIDLFKAIQPRGTICDLGCGTAEKLVKICQITNCHGLGIEQSKKAIQESKKFTKNNPNIEIINDSIMTLDGIWEDVTIAMISFVLHDISSNVDCAKILQSYKINFPMMKYLIVVDIVSPSDKNPANLPGFDYVHGLQGFFPRNYDETIQTFQKSGYSVEKEIAVQYMPNTYIWVLKSC